MADQKIKRMRCDLGESDWKRLRAVAGRAGLSMAAWIKRTLLGQIDREENEAKEPKP